MSERRVDYFIIQRSSSARKAYFDGNMKKIIKALSPTFMAQVTGVSYNAFQNIIRDGGVNEKTCKAINKFLESLTENDFLELYDFVSSHEFKIDLTRWGKLFRKKLEKKY